ncbi:MAG: hypothetical protein ACFFD8_09175 [Candidatus Thorarchaeota archaeon]
MDDLVQYLDSYFNRLPDRRSDLFSAEEIAENFLQKHPFVGQSFGKSKSGTMARIKKGFQLRVWRLTWVQSFTGLAQDVLVFAALYIGILFPDAVTPTGGVTIDYLFLGIFCISLPLYFGLVIAGFFYDKKLRMWSPDTVVKVERTPFSYVPSPRIKTFALPFFHVMLSFYYELFNEIGIETIELERLIMYLENYSHLRPDRTSDIDLAKKMRSEYGAIFHERGVE